MPMPTRKPFSKPLPGRVAAFPDEPPYGLLLRTCERNGAFQPYTNFQRAGLVTGQDVSGLAVERVAFICSQAPEAISAAAPIATTSHVRVGVETICRDQFSVLHRRWCPACMDEAPYHRVWWDALPIPACPDHGLRLTSACGCARRPLWRSSPLTKCKGGHPFAWAPRVAATPDETALADYARARLLGRDRAPNPLLDDLDLGEALRVSERIGKASLDESARYGSRRAGREGHATEGFRVLGDFGPRFDDVLDRLLAERGRRAGPRQWGAEHGYGSFYVWIAQYPGRSAFAAAIKAAVAAHAERNVTVKSGHKVAGVEVAIPAGVDMTSAAAEWGVTFERFRRLAAAIGVIPKSSLRGRPARLDPDVVRAWAPKIRSAKTREEVADELRIAPHVAASLIRDGLLPALIDGQKDRDNRLNIWLLPGGVADDLVARLAAVAKPLPEDRSKLLPISIVARTARAPLARLLRLALDGRLPIRRDPAGAGLEGFLVRKGDAQVAVRRERVPGMTITEAGAALGLHADMMSRMREEGVLRTGKVGRIHSVSSEEFQRFRAAYATSEELARDFGLPLGRSTIAALRKEGVAPAFDRPAFRQVLYDRATATAALERHRERTRTTKEKTSARAGLLDAKAFAKAVGVDQLMARQLLAAGVVDGMKTGKTYAIPPSAIAAFKAACATCTEFATVVGGNHRAVAAVFARAGVKPLYDRPDFYSALYSRAEAESAIARHLEAREAERAAKAAAFDDEPLLKSRDACKFLGCTDLMLTQLRVATTSLIRAERRGAAFVYRRSELDRFKKRYVFGTELGATIGRPGKDGGKAMTMVVMKLGVEPVCARPEFYSFLFERAEATEALKKWDGLTNRWTGRGRKVI